MESSTTFLASLMDQARLTLLGVQTEIIIFVVAFMMHGLFFRRLKVPGKGHGKQGRLKEEVSQNSEREPAGTSLRSHSAMQFAQMAERLCNIRSFQQMIAELSGELEPVRLVNFLKAVGKDRNFPANATTYNTIVKAYLQAKRYSDARHTVESMKATGFRPNGATYNEVLQIEGCSDSSETYGCRQVDVDSVESEEELDEVLLCSVVDACISAGRADVLISQLKGQWSKVPIKGSRTYANIIRAYGFVHDLAECWSTWREMRTRHIQPCAVTLGCMVEALVTNGDVDAGYELINEMLRDHEWAHLVNAVVYCSVLKGYSHQKNFDRMWHVYQEMLQHKLKFSIVTFNTLVDACSRNGQMHRIPAMLDDMDTQGISPNIITYSAIIKGYCQAGRINDAFSVLEGMVQNTRFTPDEIMYNTLLDGCARQGMVDRGMEVLKRMESDRVPPSNFTLSVLVKLCNRGKRLDKSFDLCQAISLKHKFRLNVHVYSNLIHGCIAHKDIDRALGVLEKMMCESVRPNARTYTILITACVEGKRAQDAAGLVRAAFGFAHVHPRLSRYDRKMLLTQGGNLSAAVLT
eukprot:CAMPEP_0169208970 /NCGR_PEP_ID=MMETSP1016-20121227/14420_1 /TAXON_ID=342587 /ORGANISM="Karlodinium micrum, Strain CCMP2283" /LENGTH=576 /DNA_ID=CAMNT_0009286389 /DNA_START=121 /DNA_END=1849 /DNA_ORIENTATION=+